MFKLLFHKNCILAVTIAALMSSCVSTKNMALSSQDRASLKSKTVVLTKRAMPEHSTMKSSAMMAAGLGGAIGGYIAGSMAVSEGKEQVRRHNITDPSLTIMMPLSKHLAARTGCKFISPLNQTTKLKPAEIAEENSHADYVLDVMTTSWMGSYYPMNLTKYFISYGAKMVLIESKTGKVVAEGFHFYQGNDKENAPNYDGIYANGAAFFRNETKKATDGATHHFKQQL